MNTTIPLKSLATVPVGTRIYFAEEKQPYRVKARSKRFLVCTKPFNVRKTVIYTIVDLKEGVRGPENLVFGFGAETDEQCREMVDRLEGREKPMTEEEIATVREIDPKFVAPKLSASEVSHRHRIDAKVARIVLPTK
jgi:hypothetical protein